MENKTYVTTAQGDIPVSKVLLFEIDMSFKFFDISTSPTFVSVIKHNVCISINGWLKIILVINI